MRKTGAVVLLYRAEATRVRTVKKKAVKKTLPGPLLPNPLLPRDWRNLGEIFSEVSFFFLNCFFENLTFGFYFFSPRLLPRVVLRHVQVPPPSHTNLELTIQVATTTHSHLSASPFCLPTPVDTAIMRKAKAGAKSLDRYQRMVRVPRTWGIGQKQ